MRSLRMEFDRRPSPLAFMVRAFHRTPGLRRAGGFPAVRTTWRGHVVDRDHLADFLELTGLPQGRGWPVLYPHVFGFPLVMAAVTHRAFPLALWGALQIRNHLHLRRTVDPTERLDLETAVVDQRILEKGAEADLRTTVRASGEVVWEGLTTFYYRGRHGTPGAPSPLALAPEVGDAEVARWRMARGPGRRFARLTGDYNPVHWSRLYARAFGFPRAFHHPQLAVGQCLARLAAPGEAPQTLDVWLKGPVPYDSDVRLHARQGTDGTTFGLFAGEERRPAIVGRWGPAAHPRDAGLGNPSSPG